MSNRGWGESDASLSLNNIERKLKICFYCIRNNILLVAFFSITQLESNAVQPTKFNKRTVDFSSLIDGGSNKLSSSLRRLLKYDFCDGSFKF